MSTFRIMNELDNLNYAQEPARKEGAKRLAKQRRESRIKSSRIVVTKTKSRSASAQSNSTQIEDKQQLMFEIGELLAELRQMRAKCQDLEREARLQANSKEFSPEYQSTTVPKYQNQQHIPNQIYELKQDSIDLQNEIEFLQNATSTQQLIQMEDEYSYHRNKYNKLRQEVVETQAKIDKLDLSMENHKKNGPDKRIDELQHEIDVIKNEVQEELEKNKKLKKKYNHEQQRTSCDKNSVKVDYTDEIIQLRKELKEYQDITKKSEKYLTKLEKMHQDEIDDFNDPKKNDLFITRGIPVFHEESQQRPQTETKPKKTFKTKVSPKRSQTRNESPKRAQARNESPKKHEEKKVEHPPEPKREIKQAPKPRRVAETSPHLYQPKPKPVEQPLPPSKKIRLTPERLKELESPFGAYYKDYQPAEKTEPESPKQSTRKKSPAKKPANERPPSRLVESRMIEEKKDDEPSVVIQQQEEQNTVQDQNSDVPVTNEEPNQPENMQPIPIDQLDQHESEKKASENEEEPKEEKHDEQSENNQNVNPLIQMASALTESITQKPEEQQEKEIDTNEIEETKPEVEETKVEKPENDEKEDVAEPAPLFTGFATSIANALNYQDGGQSDESPASLENENKEEVKASENKEEMNQTVEKHEDPLFNDEPQAEIRTREVAEDVADQISKNDVEQASDHKESNEDVFDKIEKSEHSSHHSSKHESNDEFDDFEATIPNDQVANISIHNDSFSDDFKNSFSEKDNASSNNENIDKTIGFIPTIANRIADTLGADDNQETNDQNDQIPTPSIQDDDFYNSDGKQPEPVIASRSIVENNQEEENKINSESSDGNKEEIAPIEQPIENKSGHNSENDNKEIDLQKSESDSKDIAPHISDTHDDLTNHSSSHSGSDHKEEHPRQGGIFANLMSQLNDKLENSDDDESKEKSIPSHKSSDDENNSFNEEEKKFSDKEIKNDFGHSGSEKQKSPSDHSIKKSSSGSAVKLEFSSSSSSKSDKPASDQEKDKDVELKQSDEEKPDTQIIVSNKESDKDDEPKPTSLFGELGSKIGDILDKEEEKSKDEFDNFSDSSDSESKSKDKKSDSESKSKEKGNDVEPIPHTESNKDELVEQKTKSDSPEAKNMSDVKISDKSDDDNEVKLESSKSSSSFKSSSENQKKKEEEEPLQAKNVDNEEKPVQNEPKNLFNVFASSINTLAQEESDKKAISDHKSEDDDVKVDFSNSLSSSSSKEHKDTSDDEIVSNKSSDEANNFASSSQNSSGNDF